MLDLTDVQNFFGPLLISGKFGQSPSRLMGG